MNDIKSAISDESFANNSVGRSERSARLVMGEIVRADGTVTAIRVTNVSARGVGGRSDSELFAGELVRVQVKLLANTMRTIKWVSGRNFGITLDQTVEPATLNFHSGLQSSVYVTPDRFKGNYIFDLAA